MKNRRIVTWAVLAACALSAPASAAEAVDAGAAEIDAVQQEQAQPHAMSAAEQQLYARLDGESPTQEGWHTTFTGAGVLAMMDNPELIVWQIVPESGRMTLLWYRDLYEFLPEDSANPDYAVSPDGGSAIVAPSDGSVYLISEDSTELIAPENTFPDNLIWAEDSLSCAYTAEGVIYVRMLDGECLTISGDVTMPVKSANEWLNPGAVPEGLDALLSGGTWTESGISATCALFSSTDDGHSCAYLFASGATVGYPGEVYSAEAVGASGATPQYDQGTGRYRLYLSDGSYADIPMLEIINESDMANPFGWLGDSVCVLEQDLSARTAFKLHAANTSTGITYTLLTPWEYEEVMQAQTADTSESSGN